MSEFAAAVADRPPLDVSADLSVTVERTRFAVDGEGDRVQVTFDSLPALLRVVRAARAGGNGDRLRRFHGLLAAAGLTAELRVDGHLVGLLGANATPGPLGRRLGGVDLRLRGLFAAAVAPG